MLTIISIILQRLEKFSDFSQKIIDKANNSVLILRLLITVCFNSILVNYALMYAFSVQWSFALCVLETMQNLEFDQYL